MHLDRTVTTIQSFIETQKENTFLGCRESSTSLITAIMSLDRVVALFGGYHCEIVARLIKRKKPQMNFTLKLRRRLTLRKPRNVTLIFTITFTKILAY